MSTVDIRVDLDRTPWTDLDPAQRAQVTRVGVLPADDEDESHTVLIVARGRGTTPIVARMSWETFAAAARVLLASYGGGAAS